MESYMYIYIYMKYIYIYIYLYMRYIHILGRWVARSKWLWTQPSPVCKSSAVSTQGGTQIQRTNILCIENPSVLFWKLFQCFQMKKYLWGILKNLSNHPKKTLRPWGPLKTPRFGFWVFPSKIEWDKKSQRLQTRSVKLRQLLWDTQVYCRCPWILDPVGDCVLDSFIGSSTSHLTLWFGKGFWGSEK